MLRAGVVAAVPYTPGLPYVNSYFIFIEQDRPAHAFSCPIERQK